MKTKTIGRAVLVAAFFLFLGSPAPGELISHHSFTTEANGPAYDCISCHDGSLAHIVSYCTVMCNFSTSHSIFKRYPPPGKEREYAPAASLAAAGIKLEKGQVTCISCHDLKNPGENHLVRLRGEKNLCRVCHIKM